MEKLEKCKDNIEKAGNESRKTLFEAISVAIM